MAVGLHSLIGLAQRLAGTRQERFDRLGRLLPRFGDLDDTPLFDILIAENGFVVLWELGQGPSDLQRLFTALQDGVWGWNLRALPVAEHLGRARPAGLAAKMVAEQIGRD